MFRGMTSVVYKEVFQILRDPRTLFLMLIIPGADMAIFGYAIDLEVRNVPTVVQNLDRRSESRALINTFINSGMFSINEYVDTEAEVENALIAGKARVGIRIPPDFTDALVQGRSATVQVLVDGSDATVAMQTLQAAHAIGLRQSLHISTKELGMSDTPLIEARTRVLYNPDLRTPNFMIPGLIAVIMQVIVMMLTALSIVREKENGTLEQLMVTPVSRLGLLVGKLTPYILLGCIETLIVFLIMVFLFKVPIAGSIGLLTLFSIPFIFVALGFGLLISTATQTQMQALQFSMIFILPAIILSGFMFPRESMPLLINWLGWFIPATYYIQIMRGIVLRGAGFVDLWFDGVILTLMGVAVIGLAAVRFRKTIH